MKKKCYWNLTLEEKNQIDMTKFISFLVCCFFISSYQYYAQDLKYWFPEEDLITTNETKIIPKNSIALVIGNTNYDQQDLVLKNPINDVHLMSDVLTKLGFNVIEKHDLSKVNMIQEFRGLRQKSNNYEFVLIFFAGHAIQDPNGNSYLIPIDYMQETSIEKLGVNIKEIITYFEQSETPSLLIFDACRATYNSGLSKPNIEDPMNVKVAYSTSYGKTASDNAEFTNTIYTSTITKLFTIEGLTIQEILHNTSKFVLKQTDKSQYPVDYFGIEIEDFSFGHN
mgnify:CR=1 FL=1